MKKKNRAFYEMKPLLTQTFGEAVCTPVLDHAEKIYDRLCREHRLDPKAVKKITESDIYPCISLYQALTACGIDSKRAVTFLDDSWSKRAEKNAKMMQMAMKLPGMYKKMPAMFRSVAVHQFGEAAGFKAHYYDTEKTRVKFDMTKCLYCDVCKAEGCPELVPCFCHTDDVNNGHLHPKLCWNRTKIMGDGGDVCDFDLYVVKDEPKK